MLEYGLEERPRVLTNVGRLASACVPVFEDNLFGAFVLLKKDALESSRTIIPTCLVLYIPLYCSPSVLLNFVRHNENGR